MLTAWRLVKQRHAATAFSGEGAARSGGRWNSRGQQVVYASAAQSLCVLESLVHLDPAMMFPYVIFRIEIPESVIDTLPPKKLVGDWRSEPPSTSTKKLGDLWLKEKCSAVLAVPSALVPAETNYLLNPAHPDFKKLKIGKPTAFSIDHRLNR